MSPATPVKKVIESRLRRAGVRVTWLPRLSQDDFASLLALADVSLDPPAWSGGTTTLQALAYGRPVVTLPGEFMRGRHSLAFLRQCGAEALAASSADEYVELASDFDRLRDTMARAETDRLFEDRRPAKALSDFFRMVARLVPVSEHLHRRTVHNPGPQRARRQF